MKKLIVLLTICLLVTLKDNYKNQLKDIIRKDIDLNL
jgi:hypothetical protein